MRRITKQLCCCLIIVISFLFISACSNDGNDTVQLTEQEKIYNLYVKDARQKGEIPLSYEEWLESVEGKKGDKGDTGNGILSIEKTDTEGNIDIYTITYTNGDTTTFTVTNDPVIRFELDKVKDFVATISKLEDPFDNELALGMVYKEDSAYIYVITEYIVTDDICLRIGDNGILLAAEIYARDYDADISVLRVSKEEIENKNGGYSIAQVNEEAAVGDKVILLDTEKDIGVTFISKILDRGYAYVKSDEEWKKYIHTHSSIPGNIIGGTITTIQPIFYYEIDKITGNFQLMFNEKNEIIGVFLPDVDEKGSFNIKKIINLADELISKKENTDPITDIEFAFPKITYAQLKNKILNTEDFVLVLAAPECVYCHEYAVTLNTYKENNPSKNIYYLNINEAYAENENSLNEIIEMISDIQYREYGESISSPTTIYVKDGLFLDVLAGNPNINNEMDYIAFTNFMEGKYVGREMYDELSNEISLIDKDLNAFYLEAVLKVAEASYSTNSNIEIAVQLAIDNFEKQVEKYAELKLIPYTIARDYLLNQYGHETMEDLQNFVKAQLKFTQLVDEYLESEEAYDKFIDEKLPYLVSHILVRADYNYYDSLYTTSRISTSDAERIVDVIKGFESGETFAALAETYSEDNGSNRTGGSYYMDKTYVGSFVDEFIYGTFMFDTYMNKNSDDSYTYTFNADRMNKLIGSSDNEQLLEYYKDGFNFIDMSIVDLLDEHESNYEYFSISQYDKTIENGETIYTSVTSTYPGSSSTSTKYPRNIIFSQAFNKPGVSIIGYSNIDEIPEGVTNYVKVTMGNDDKYILTDEKGHPIFMVVAQGSNSELWIHFMKIDVSSLTNKEEAKKYFTLNPNLEDSYLTYIEQFSTTKEDIIENREIIKQYIKNYAGDRIDDSEQYNDLLLKFDAYEYLMNKNQINIGNTLKENTDTYINSSRIEIKETIQEHYDEILSKHIDKLVLSTSEEVIRDRIPYECIRYSYSDRSNRCRYITGEGYEIRVDLHKFMPNDSLSNDGDISNYEDIAVWVKIGEKKILPELRIIKDHEIYVTEGWYQGEGTTDLLNVDAEGNYYIMWNESSINNSLSYTSKMVNPKVSICLSFYPKNDQSINFNNPQIHVYSLMETSETELLSGIDINLILFDAIKEGSTFVGWKVNDQYIEGITSEYLNDVFSKKTSIGENTYQYGDIRFDVRKHEITLTINITAVFE